MFESLEISAHCFPPYQLTPVVHRKVYKSSDKYKRYEVCVGVGIKDLNRFFLSHQLHLQRQEKK